MLIHLGHTGWQLVRDGLGGGGGGDGGGRVEMMRKHFQHSKKTGKAV